jgi:hypothetical protein
LSSCQDVAAQKDGSTDRTIRRQTSIGEKLRQSYDPYSRQSGGRRRIEVLRPLLAVGEHAVPTSMLTSVWLYLHLTDRGPVATADFRRRDRGSLVLDITSESLTWVRSGV